LLPKPAPTPKPTPSFKPPPKPVERERAQKQAEKREEQRKAREEARKAREDARRARSSQAHESSAKPSGADVANYRAIIYSEIAQALAGVAGDGSASISFSVAGSGRIAGCSVSRSSGSGEFGSLCGRMRSIHAPPPPGGAFAGRITVRLHGS
jgi:protein TonB